MWRFYREFGNIFAELLPGNFSKLQPPKGMDITQGLEVKVRLGTVWKASLTELSGGQRYITRGRYAARRSLTTLSQISHRPFAYHGALALQASTDVHSR